MGCNLERNKVVTSGMVTIHHLKKYYKNQKVYLLGTPELEEQFIKEGIDLVEKDPDLVVVGFDTTITYDRLSRACTFIRQGATFIATHPDFNCPTEDGFIPDCGAICAFITASTGEENSPLGVSKLKSMTECTALPAKASLSSFTNFEETFEGAGGE
jgi:4-nitrophenyl phosphatase